MKNICLKRCFIVFIVDFQQKACLATKTENAGSGKERETVSSSSVIKTREHKAYARKYVTHARDTIIENEDVEREGPFKEEPLKLSSEKTLKAVPVHFVAQANDRDTLLSSDWLEEDSSLLTGVNIYTTIRQSQY